MNSDNKRDTKMADEKDKQNQQTGKSTETVDNNPSAGKTESSLIDKVLQETTI